MLIGTGEAAGVGALGSADAADEERHVGIFGRQRLRLHFSGQNERRKRGDCESNCKLHGFLSTGYDRSRLRTNPKPADFFHNRIAWQPSARLSSGLAIKCL